MKKWMLSAALLICLNSRSQTCEQKEPRLLQAIGGFTAATLYNTYGMIGSISDGYAKGAYDAKTVEQLMTAQQTLATHLAGVLDSMLKDNVFSEQTDKDFASGSIRILNDLKAEAGFLGEYARTNSSKKQEAYEEKRKQNWSAISKLMGIEE